MFSRSRTKRKRPNFRVAVYGDQYLIDAAYVEVWIRHAVALMRGRIYETECLVIGIIIGDFKLAGMPDCRGRFHPE
jgi:hypothetical protein